MYRAYNPFTSKYHIDEENRNSIAGYERRTYCNAAENLFLAQISWNINWGDKKNNGQKKHISEKVINDMGTTAVGK